MSVTKQWMLVLILTAVISVAIHSLVLSTLINRYYASSSEDNYREHVSQLVEFSEKILTEITYSEEQLEIHFDTHLTDSISRIRLYDTDGYLLADVRSADDQIPDMMNRGMMRSMIGSLTEETEAIDIISNSRIVGQLLITKTSSFGRTMSSRMFTVSLIGNSLISFVLVLIFISVLGIFVSRKMSRDLKLTAKQAANIGLNDQKASVTSHINEIRTIQHSLEELQMRLKLRQTSRKKLIDELVHQTRTPLTILSSHLEGLSDGVLQFSPDEMIICESQIENLTAMIRNISNMIDADKDIEQLHIEQIEIRQLLKQITDGLRVQFLNKNVQLKLPDKEKIVLKTDRHKLSQAIYNLLTNAYKFSAPGDQVTIDYQQVADSLTISVKDTGAGIHEEDLNRIFDPYFRGKNAGSITGEGIGLYIAKENVQQLGGQISVQSHPGEGSIFSISLNIAANRPK